jgi:hypothetical protein
MILVLPFFLVGRNIVILLTTGVDWRGRLLRSWLGEAQRTMGSCG